MINNLRFFSDRQERKIIFLANEVLLAHQQASYFKARLTHGILPDESQSVECLTGDLDFWGTDEWDEVFSKRHVSQVISSFVVKTFIVLVMIVVDFCRFWL